MLLWSSRVFSFLFFSFNFRDRNFYFILFLFVFTFILFYLFYPVFVFILCFLFSFLFLNFQFPVHMKTYPSKLNTQQKHISLFFVPLLTLLFSVFFCNGKLWKVKAIAILTRLSSALTTIFSGVGGYRVLSHGDYFAGF